VRPLGRIKGRLKALCQRADSQIEARLLDGWTINELLVEYQRNGRLPENDLQRRRVLQIDGMLRAMDMSVPKSPSPCDMRGCEEPTDKVERCQHDTTSNQAAHSAS